MDRLFKIASIPNKGRGLVALQNLPKGQKLFAERPIISCIREDKLGKYCSFCYNPLSEAEMESNLETQYDTFHTDCVDVGAQQLFIEYCGVRNRDYTIVDNKKFPAMSTLILGNILRQSLNEESTLFEGILGHLCYANNTEWKIDRIPYDHWIDYILNVKKLNINKDELITIVPFEMYDRLLRILHLNCISITYNDDDVGTGLFGLGSFFNHSCDPNVEIQNVMELHSGYGIFNTLCDIKEGDELCIQYAGKNDTYNDRQNYFMWMYGFQCECNKCLADKADIDQEAQKIQSS